MIYERIKERSQQLGLSIRAVEQKAGLGNGTIGKWADASPTIDKLAVVAKVLGTTVDDLLDEPKAG